MRLVYVIGVPGAGKTTTTTAAIRILEWTRTPGHSVTVPHDQLATADGTVIAAHLGRPGLGGTDTLPLAVTPMASAWVRRIAPLTYRLVIGEGHRLGTPEFLDQHRDIATVVALTCSATTAVARRAARGAMPNAAWVGARVAAVEQLMPRAHRVITTDGPLVDAAADLAAVITAALRDTDHRGRDT